MSQHLQVKSATIRVSTNTLIEGGYFYDLRVHAILPRCRKVALLSFYPMPGYILASDLYSSQSCQLSAEAYLTIVNKATVLPAPDYLAINRPTITPAIERMARDHAAFTAQCPAITQPTLFTPSYAPIMFV